MRFLAAAPWLCKSSACSDFALLHSANSRAQPVSRPSFLGNTLSSVLAAHFIKHFKARQRDSRARMAHKKLLAEMNEGPEAFERFKKAVGAVLTVPKSKVIAHEKRRKARKKAARKS